MRGSLMTLAAVSALVAWDANSHTAYLWMPSAIVPVSLDTYVP